MIILSKMLVILIIPVEVQRLKFRLLMTAGATTNITVTRNKVFSSKNEGIGLYKKVTNSTVEYNVVYDIRTYHIYIDAS